MLPLGVLGGAVGGSGLEGKRKRQGSLRLQPPLFWIADAQLVGLLWGGGRPKSLGPGPCLVNGQWLSGQWSLGESA